ncbi:MAG: pyrimidine-nucleoside phosphorylase [Streptococcaceae bacterium]|nr:pyrimidine-nucleoside phosphorylase [Streptococcaceae bacterium]
MTYRMVDLIQKKRDGEILDKAEINWMIESYVTGAVPDYQMSAFAMATYFKGMTSEEIADLTMAMVKTGEQIDLSDIPGIKVDKHSTGGVGDKVSIILVPLVASFGVPVAKMSGRGLGHTGGTLDKLESIPGYRIEYSIEEFKAQVRDIGLSIIGQSDDLVKADKLLYALRDVTGTVDQIPLIASSIMSKKIASGADAILLDVTVGNGAFMKNIDDARILARTMVDLGNAVGRKTVAVITNMNQPLGYAVGNHNEIAEAVEVLTGGSTKEFRTYIAVLAQIMLQLAGVEKTTEEIIANFDNGQAYEKLMEMIAAQGGDASNISEPLQTKYIVEITADQHGFIEKLGAMDVGLVAMKLGAGRATKADSIDFQAGINLHAKIGDAVSPTDVIATLYSNQPIGDALIAEFKSAVNIGSEQKEYKEILEIIR